MSNIAIQFDNVGKLYKLGLVGTGSLVHDLNRWWKTSILRQEDPYLKIGETEILLAEKVRGECAPKTNTECITVCVSLPKCPEAELMTLIIKSDDEYSSEYILKYNCKEKAIKKKMLNSI